MLVLALPPTCRQALSSPGVRTEQLDQSGFSADESAQLANAFAGRGRDGDDEDGGVHPDSTNVDQVAYEQWFRAASLRKWFGEPSPGHEGDITGNTHTCTNAAI